jgi:3-isopropylmalate dehydrogenase
MLLSAALMLDWLGQQHGEPACLEAGLRLEIAIEDGFRAGALAPIEQGGRQTTADVAGALAALL